MISRNENGEIISVDKLSDVTDELKKTEKLINSGIKKGDKLSEEENAKIAKAADEMKILLDFAPELQKNAGPIELISFLKQVVSIKKIAEAIKEKKDD